MLSWEPPYRAELETWGRLYGDVDRCGNDLIVSRPLRELVEESGIRGLLGWNEIEIVRIRHRRGKPIGLPPAYFKASVSYSPTTIDQKASGYEWTDEQSVCPSCLCGRLKRRSRIVVDESTWNGDDVFFPRGGSFLLASARFKRLFEEHGMKGMVFQDTEEASYDNLPWEP
jgi:hypothetical protein